MTTGWTGGQYSVLRAVLAVVCAYRLFAFDLATLVFTTGLVLCVLLAIGFHDRLAALHESGELGDRQLPGRGCSGRRGAGACAHGSSSRGTLSISRVLPTRTAAARTGGENGAAST